MGRASRSTAVRAAKGSGSTDPISTGSRSDRPPPRRRPYVPPDLSIIFASVGVGLLVFILVPWRRVVLREDGSIEVIRRWACLRRSRRILNDQIAYLGTSFREGRPILGISLERIFAIRFVPGSPGYSPLLDHPPYGRWLLAIPGGRTAGTCSLWVVLGSGERIPICRTRNDAPFNGVVDYFRAGLGVELRRL